MDTCPQFWRMVEQEEVTTIVMLCQVQPGFTGCSQYFPNSTGDKIVTSTVSIQTNVKTQDLGNGIVVRDIEMQHGASGNKQRSNSTIVFSLRIGGKRSVRHIQFTLWPNYGVVENVSQLAGFAKYVYDNHNAETPMVVHCSGGVGRSGAFTSIYSVLSILHQMQASEDESLLKDHLGSQGDLCLASLVCHLRKTRHPWMVEGVHQYNLAYQTCNFLISGFI